MITKIRRTVREFVLLIVGKGRMLKYIYIFFSFKRQNEMESHNQRMLNAWDSRRVSVRANKSKRAFVHGVTIISRRRERGQCKAAGDRLRRVRSPAPTTPVLYFKFAPGWPFESRIGFTTRRRKRRPTRADTCTHKRTNTTRERRAYVPRCR